MIKQGFCSPQFISYHDEKPAVEAKENLDDFILKQIVRKANMPWGKQEI